MANIRSPKGYAQKFAICKTGDVIEVTRNENQNDIQFKTNVSVMKSHYRTKFGIETVIAMGKDQATLTVARGHDNPLPVAERNTKGPRSKAAPIAAPVAAPVEAPRAHVHPVVDAINYGEDAGEFWQEMFLASLKAAPGAPAALHGDNAAKAVSAYRARFCPA